MGFGIHDQGENVLDYLKHSFIRASMLGLTLSLVGAALADDVHFTGSTLGRFNSDSFASTDTLLGLVYTNSTFDNTSVGGQLDLGGNPAPGVNFNNFGSFTLAMDNETYDGNMFQVQITFTAPFTIAGGDTAVYTDKLFGTVTDGNGGVFIDFDNTPQTFTFANATTSGSFSLFINDVSIAPGQSSSLTGHISANQSPVPEPMSLAGLACGAFGLITVRRIHFR